MAFVFRNHTRAVAVLCLALTAASCSTGEKGKTLSKTERAGMFLEIANAALMEGDPTGALQSLAMAEKFDPDLPEIYHSKALAFLAKHDSKSALTFARKAVQMAPNYCDANNTLGKLLVDAGQYEEAEPPLKIAAENPLYRDAYKAFTNLGILRYRKDDLAGALNFFNRAIQESKTLACIAYYYRGHIQMRQSRLNEAISSYDLATRKYCASFSDAHLALGIAYERTRQFQKARKKFLEIQQRYPDSEIAQQAVSHLRYLP